MLVLAVIALGLVLGILSSLAPLGPVTVLVLRRALMKDYRGAMAIGLGRILPEVAYSAFATFGMAALLEEVPTVKTVMEALGAFILILVGIAFAIARHEKDDGTEPKSSGSGFGAGFMLSALNPTLIVSWSAIVAVTISLSGVEPTLTHKVLFPLCIGAGIALGYLALVWTVRRWGHRLEERAVAILLRTIGVVLIALGIYHGAHLAGWLS